VLRDPVARVEYLLELEGMRKEGEHKQQAPPELLEEVFELNESLDELREAKTSGGDLGSLKHRLESAEKNFSRNSAKSTRNYRKQRNSGTRPSTPTPAIPIAKGSWCG